MRILIPHDFSYEKYYPEEAELPYEATGAALRDEIAARDAGIDLVLSFSQFETSAALAEAEGIIAYNLPSGLLDKAPRLRWVQAASAGVDHFFKSSGITSEELRRRGITLTKASGVTRLVIGEHVFAMILALTRGVPRAVRQQMRHEWRIFTGTEIYGQTLGIIGLGEIGERVAELGRAFGMRVVGTCRDRSTYAGHAHSAYAHEEFEHVLEQADIVVLTCVLNDRTRGMVNKRTLAQMRQGALLVNVARGEVIVEADLVAALTSGKLGGAALDTFGRPGREHLRDLEALDSDSALWELENVLVMPNNAAGTDRVFGYLAEIVVRNHRLIDRGEIPPNAVVS